MAEGLSVSLGFFAGNVTAKLRWFCNLMTQQWRDTTCRGQSGVHPDDLSKVGKRAAV